MDRAAGRHHHARLLPARPEAQEQARVVGGEEQRGPGADATRAGEHPAAAARRPRHPGRDPGHPVARREQRERGHARELGARHAAGRVLRRYRRDAARGGGESSGGLEDEPRPVRRQAHVRGQRLVPRDPRNAQREAKLTVRLAAAGDDGREGGGAHAAH